MEAGQLGGDVNVNINMGHLQAGAADDEFAAALAALNTNDGGRNLGRLSRRSQKDKAGSKVQYCTIGDYVRSYICIAR